MLVDGKEININYSKANEIQNRINSIQEIPETAKTELSKKEINELIQGTNYDTNGGGYFDNCFDQNNNVFLTGNELQENRGEYYQTFEDMSNNPFVYRGLCVIADDASQKNDEGTVVKVYSDDDDIKEELENLFNKRLNLAKELWSIVYETIKLGDNFYEIIPDSYENPTRISRIRYLDPRKVNRIEKNGKLAFYTYIATLDNENESSFNPETQKQERQEAVYRLQPWQIIHFKISDKDFYPYGGSLLKSGVNTFRRYTMLEDAMLIYRLARVPERHVFKIDIGNLSASEGAKAVNKIADAYRSKQIMDDKGRINKQAAALSLTQDIFIPTREGQGGTNIESLGAGNALNNIDDIRFFRDELLWTLNIPPEYLGTTSDGQGMQNGKGSLAMQDIKFARFVERIQYYIEEGLTKIAAIELFFSKKKKSELENFRIELTPPSNVKELIDLEYLNQKMNTISLMIGTQLFPKEFILKYVMKMSRKEIEDINIFKELESQQQGGMQMDAGMGMGMDAGMGAAPMGVDNGMGGGMQMSVKTEGINPEKMVKLFGKDFLIENKEDYSKLLKAAQDYEQEKAKNQELNEMSDSEFLTIARKSLLQEKTIPSTSQVSSLFYSNELGGLDFANKSYKVYKKGKKIIEEEIKL